MLLYSAKSDTEEIQFGFIYFSETLKWHSYATYLLYVRHVSLSPTVTVTSALLRAWSLSKCHFVAFVFFPSFLQRNLISGEKRYVAPRTVTLTVCFFKF